MATFVAAIIVFMWGTVSWMMLPWHNWEMKSFQHEGQMVTAAIKVEALESGIYMLPNYVFTQDKNQQAAWAEKAKQGPFAYLSVKVEGQKASMTCALLIQFLTQWVVSIFAIGLLKQTAISGVVKKALFVSLTVTLGAFLVHFSNWNWWAFPSLTTLVNIADVMIGWLLAGVAIAKIVRS